MYHRPIIIELIEGAQSRLPSVIRNDFHRVQHCLSSILCDSDEIPMKNEEIVENSFFRDYSVRKDREIF